MTSAWRWLATAIGLGIGTLGGCGGDSKSDGGSAGMSGGGAGGTAGTASGGAGTMGGSSAGTSSAGESGGGECAKADCGPQLGLPNWTCADGSVGGPTGRCLKRAGATCGWEINNCPMAGAGAGGTSSQGGQGGASGDAGAGGAQTERCGGCSPGTICVFQVGGPGPSHFVCATQNPCGSAAACACIVGQGTCQPNLVGDPPSYCSCNNMLE